MMIQVRLFSALRELLGESTLVIELPEGSTVAEALSRLEQEHQLLAGRKYAAAVNECYAESGRKLVEQDQLALIPPVSGG